MKRWILVSLVIASIAKNVVKIKMGILNVKGFVE
jgi:hypothetical protein